MAQPVTGGLNNDNLTSAAEIQTVEVAPAASAGIQPAIDVSDRQVEAAQAVVAAVEVRHHESISSALGGRKTLAYIVGNEMLEKLSIVGLQSIMTMYLKREYHLENTTAANILFMWNSFTNFTPILGALASDSYGQFRVIGISSVITLLGLVILWVTALVPNARPYHCWISLGYCDKASSKQLLLLLSAFLLTAIGAGGIRPCSPTFGEDQIRDSSDPDNRRKIDVFYSWYYTSVRVAMIISIMAISKLQFNYGWGIVFGVPVIMMFAATVVFLSGNSRYVKMPPGRSSVLRSFGRVVAAAWRKRGQSPSLAEARWFHESGSTFVRPTSRLSFLNKACQILTPEEEVKSLASGMPNQRSSLCTVRQVEELKALIRVIPIWSTGIMIGIANNPGPIVTLQAQIMDRRFLGSNFTIQPGAYTLFSVAAMTLWLAFYIHLIVPSVAKMTSNRVPNGIPAKYRIGIGLALSCLANIVAGAVEHYRRREKTWLGKITVSANLLIPQFLLMGLADAFNTMGQIDFYNSQFPAGSMKTIGNALLWLGQCVAGMVAVLILAAVKRLTTVTSSSGEKISWVDNELNIGHYDYYYWVIAVLSLLNLLYYLICCRAYGDAACLPWEEEAAYDHDQGQGPASRGDEGRAEA
ncbi:Protein NRT1/ PTR FAMILY 1.1 [Linum perenne]